MSLSKIAFLLISISLFAGCNSSKGKSQSIAKNSGKDTSKESFRSQQVKPKCLPNGKLLVKKKAFVDVNDYEFEERGPFNYIAFNADTLEATTTAKLQFNHRQTYFEDGLGKLSKKVNLVGVNDEINSFTREEVNKKKKTFQYNIPFKYSNEEHWIKIKSPIPKGKLGSSDLNKSIKSWVLEDEGIKKVKICSAISGTQGLYIKMVGHHDADSVEEIVYRVEVTIEGN